jgi:hypothetical protein
LVVLKNKDGQIIAMQGIHQFQSNRPEFLINKGNMTSFVKDSTLPGHAFISNIFIDPEMARKFEDPKDPLYKKKAEVELALHQKLLQQAKKMNNRYVHYLADVKSSTGTDSHIVKELGYRVLKPATKLDDAPDFTLEQNKNLIAAYNHGSLELHWKDLLEQAVKSKL